MSGTVNGAAGGAAGGTAGTGADVPVVVRPFKVRVAAWVGAVVLVAVMVVIAALLPTTVNAGVYFRLADQVALVLLGVLIAGGVLLLARPRVRADAEGVEVRNTGLARRLPWTDVRRVSFPDGASWARLDLPDDEYLPVLAVQAADGARAVDAITRLRALHAAAVAPAAADSRSANAAAAGHPAADPAAADPAAADDTADDHTARDTAAAGDTAATTDAGDARG